MKHFIGWKDIPASAIEGYIDKSLTFIVERYGYELSKKLIFLLPKKIFDEYTEYICVRFPGMNGEKISYIMCHGVCVMQYSGDDAKFVFDDSILDGFTPWD